MRVAILALFAVLIPPSAMADVVRGPYGARIDSFMTAVAELGVQGSLLVEKDGTVIVHKGYGIANRATGARAEAETPYLLGSLSKQFTAAAVYKLESQGKLSLADTLGRWLPGVPPDKRAITLDHLVHHTAGLVYLTGGLFDSISSDSMVRAVLASKLDFAPGERYQYSNPGYNLLGVVVAKASGVSFNEYLRRALFEPAGMTKTAFSDEPERWPASLRTPSYSTADPDPVLYPTGRLPYTTGAGTVVSTCGDLWKWEQALRGEKVLPRDAVAKLFAPGPVSGPTSKYAGGWQVAQSQRNTTVIMHAGDLGGFNADMRRLVDEHATIVFLSNGRQGGRGFREAVTPAVTRLLFGPTLELPPAQRGDGVWLAARTQEDMSRLAGSDSTARAAELRISGWARGVADSLLGPDSLALEARFHPSLPVESHGEFFRAWHAYADSVGGSPRIAVLGTVFVPPNAARTYVELTGPAGARVLSLDWVRDRLIGSEPIPDAAYRVRFFPDDSGALARYDLWAGRIVRTGKASAATH